MKPFLFVVQSLSSFVFYTIETVGKNFTRLIFLSTNFLLIPNLGNSISVGEKKAQVSVSTWHFVVLKITGEVRLDIFSSVMLWAFLLDSTVTLIKKAFTFLGNTSFSNEYYRWVYRANIHSRCVLIY